MSTLRIYPYFAISDTPATGLTLAEILIDVWRIKKSDNTVAHVVDGAPVEKEIGGGYYYYSLPNVDYTTYDYIPHVHYTGVEEVDSPRLFAPEYQQEDVSARRVLS